MYICFVWKRTALTFFKILFRVFTSYPKIYILFKQQYRSQTPIFYHFYWLRGKTGSFHLGMHRIFRDKTFYGVPQGSVLGFISIMLQRLRQQVETSAKASSEGPSSGPQVLMKKGKSVIGQREREQEKGKSRFFTLLKYCTSSSYCL